MITTINEFKMVNENLKSIVLNAIKEIKSVLGYVTLTDLVKKTKLDRDLISVIIADDLEMEHLEYIDLQS